MGILELSLQLLVEDRLFIFFCVFYSVLQYVSGLRSPSSIARDSVRVASVAVNIFVNEVNGAADH
jgi:hypothetical protein